MPGVRSPHLQAAILAAAAAIWPGAAFGIAYGVACREGSWPAIEPGTALRGPVVVVACTEAAATCSGLLEWALAWHMWGEAWYPEWLSPTLAATQTTQLTAYAAGAAFAGVAVVAALAWRWRAARLRCGTRPGAGGR